MHMFICAFADFVGFMPLKPV